MSDIYIQGESLQVEKKFDYAIIEGINETVESLKPKIIKVVPMVHYDDTEKIIGTWFGETLYEKTYVFSTPIELNPTNRYFNSNIIISNIDKIVLSNAVDENGQTMSVYVGKYSNNELALANISSINIAINYLTIQYTKTTD